MLDEEIKDWYDTQLCEAFAANERKPLQEIQNMIANGQYELWGLYDEGARLLGYAAIWKREGIPLVLLDYLGVDVRYRNCGLGSEILEELRAQGRLTVTESELPVPGANEADNELRRRRLAFYGRNGFTPVYEMATCGMRWQALVISHTTEDKEDLMRWHRSLYGPERKDVRIPLNIGEEPLPPYWMIVSERNDTRKN